MAKFWEKIKEHKEKQFRDALSAAGVDAGTADKVMTSLKEIADEKNKEFKELRVKWHADMMKRLEAAGLSQEKVAEVVSKYKEMKKASMVKFLQERLQPQEQTKGEATPSN